MKTRGPPPTCCPRPSASQPHRGPVLGEHVATLTWHDSRDPGGGITEEGSIVGCDPPACRDNSLANLAVLYPEPPEKNPNEALGVDVGLF